MIVCILVYVYKTKRSTTSLLHVYVAHFGSCYYEAMFSCGYWDMKY